MPDPSMRNSRLRTQVGAVIFGVLLGALITGSIQHGAGVVFPKEKQDWILGFWGSHYILRTIASLVGTVFGAFASGCIGKRKGSICGLASTLPTSLFWIFVGFFGYSHSLMTTWQWIVVVAIVLLSPILGFYMGGIGETVHISNPHIFEARKNTILAIKWYHWFWLVIVIEWIGAFATYGFYQGLWLSFGIKRTAFWHTIVGGFVSLLIYIGLYFLFMGAYKTFYLLSLGHQEGLSNRTIAVRILCWTLGIWIIVGAVQFLANLLMFKF